MRLHAKVNLNLVIVPVAQCWCYVLPGNQYK